MSSGTDRVLRWDGLVNGRDLGGFATEHGPIQPHRLVRSASVHTLTATGWQALLGHGIRTIIDLRHEWEINEAPIPLDLHPSEVTIVQLPLEPAGYIEKWSKRGDQWKLATPHYLGEFMADHADRVGMVLEAMANAEPGGVLIHCFSGRDRAGLTVAMLLDLVGVEHELIAADYWISFDRPKSVEAELGLAKQSSQESPERAEYTNILIDLLRSHPATGCFVDPETADATRSRLTKRLCTVGNATSVD